MVVPVGQVLLASSGRRPGMWPNIVRCTRASYNAHGLSASRRNEPGPNVDGAEIEKSCGEVPTQTVGLV